jgi:hypothetical protein
MRFRLDLSSIAPLQAAFVGYYYKVLSHNKTAVYVGLKT